MSMISSLYRAGCLIDKGKLQCLSALLVEITLITGSTLAITDNIQSREEEGQCTEMEASETR